MYKSVISSILISIVFQLSAIANSENGPNSLFVHRGDFQSALNEASSNGKLLLVDFYADWCTPCKYMDKTTFKNNNVVDMLNTNFVTYKANIDSKDGFQTKEKYNIQYVPTILIFNTKGELVERIEETMTATNLLPILEFHNHPNNKLKIIHHFNQSPEQPTVKKSDGEMTDAELRLLYEQYQQQERVKSSYRLQVGVYSDYQDAYNLVNSLREDFLEPIVVLNDIQDGKTLYKVMMGDFKTRNEADSFRNILQQSFNISSIVN